MSERDVLQLAEYAGLTDHQALDRLLEVTETGRVTAQQSLAAAAKVLTDAEQDLVSATLLAAAGQSAAMADYRALLLGPGLDWSDSRFQSRLDLLAAAGSWPAETLATLKAIGIQTAPCWQSYTGVLAITVEPTLESIAAARATIATDAVRQQLADRYNAVVAAMDAGEVATWDAVRAAMGAP